MLLRMMNSRSQANRNSGNHSVFFLGLVTGALVGAGLAMAFAPKLVSELRKRVTDAADDFTDAASKRYNEATSRVADAVDEVATRGQAVRDDVADAVGRGARSVEQFAMASKSDGRR